MCGRAGSVAHPHFDAWDIMDGKTRLLERLSEAERKYIEIEQALSSPDVVSDVEKYAKLSREYKTLTPVVEKYREYVATDRERRARRS